MKNIKVIKIGGSVLRTSKDYIKIAKKISQNIDSSICIVISAMKGKTDELASTFLEAISSPDFWSFERFVGMGEVQSAILLEAVFKSLGKSSIAVLPWMKEWPLFISLKKKQPISASKSNEQRDFSVLQKSKTRTKRYLTHLLHQYDVVIIPGFIAKDGRGRVITFGRGGSDISAFLIAELLNAKELVLLKDVGGIMNLDPNIDKKYVKIESLDSDELGIIASSGSQVLNPISLKYRKNLMKMKVVSIDSKSLNSGTEISFGKETTIKYFDTVYSVLTFTGYKIPETPGILYRISKILAKKNISIHSVTISDNVLALYVNDENALDAYISFKPILKNIKNLRVLALKRNIGKVVIRSLKFINEPGIIKKIVIPISREGINIWEVLTVHTDVMVFVDKKDIKRTYKVIKKIFEKKR